MQYRFPEALANFPSSEFYEKRLKSAITGEEAGRVLAPLDDLAFPWPRVNGRIQPAVFVHCTTEEDYGGMSKSNEGQGRRCTLHRYSTQLGIHRMASLYPEVRRQIL